jgi:hypothetical protein
MDQALAMADVLVKACEQLSMLLGHLRELKGLDKQWIEIHRLENDGDRLFREAFASLFAGGIDPMVVIRWRDIFSQARAGDRRNRARRNRRPDHRDEVRLRAVTVRPPRTGADCGLSQSLGGALRPDRDLERRDLQGVRETSQ